MALASVQPFFARLTLSVAIGFI